MTKRIFVDESPTPRYVRDLEKEADAILFDPDKLVLASEDALDQRGNVSLDDAAQADLTTYFQCTGCDFPHLSEQQALNCCPPRQVWLCPACGGMRDSPENAIDCCR